MQGGMTGSLLLCVGMTASSFAAAWVDLDQPGAMDALARDRPADYQKVTEAIAKAQTIYIDPAPGLRDARLDERSRGATTLLPSDPAKKRSSLVVDLTEYRFTVRMTKSPGKIEKAQ